MGDSLMFKSTDDRYRFIFSLYEFNTTNLIEIRKRREERKKEKASECLTPADVRDKVVEILAFCFMPNHVHLLLKQSQSNGISYFMKKVGGGYANYFNKKYQRKGHLFSKFKAVHIKDDKQLKNVFAYIHCNPISLMEAKWKEKGVSNPKKVIKFLENYKWSSYRDYIGVENFTSLTSRNFFHELLGGVSGCRLAVEDWVRYKNYVYQSYKDILE